MSLKALNVLHSFSSLIFSFTGSKKQEKKYSPDSATRMPRIELTTDINIPRPWQLLLHPKIPC